MALVGYTFLLQGQTKPVSSFRALVKAGTLVNQQNQLDIMGGVAMSTIGEYQWSYEHIGGPTWAKSLGLGAVFSFREVLELEASYERSLITQSWNFANGYTYFSSANTVNITAIITNYEFNKLLYGGSLSYPLFGKFNQFVFASGYLTQMWMDDRTLYSADYKSGAIQGRQSAYNENPDQYNGPLFSSVPSTNRLTQLFTFGLGFKWVTKSRAFWKLGMYYTAGDDEIYRFTHDWYQNGQLVNQNAWIHTAAHLNYQLQVGIPIWKGKRRERKPKEDKPEPKEEPVVAEEPVEVEEEPKEPTVDDANTSMPTDLYLANNVVFLIDISASMLQRQKMDKVKDAMVYMTDSLRTFDQVGVVTYNNEARVLLDPVAADSAHRKDIKKSIIDIEASGMTNGVAGLRTAYTMALRHMIEGGSNQVILVTDGEFGEQNEKDREIKDLLDAFDAKGIQLTIVSTNPNGDAQKSMKAMARRAGGEFVYVDDAESFDAVFLEIIKKHARKTD